MTGIRASVDSRCVYIYMYTYIYVCECGMMVGTSNQRPSRGFGSHQLCRTVYLEECAI